MRETSAYALRHLEYALRHLPCTAGELQYRSFRLPNYRDSPDEHELGADGSGFLDFSEPPALLVSGRVPSGRGMGILGSNSTKSRRLEVPTPSKGSGCAAAWVTSVETGQPRHIERALATSALPPRADILLHHNIGRDGPISDSCTAALFVPKR